MDIIASVIIPAYGRNEAVDRAIRSVLAQPGSEMVEIIVVDDCSPAPLLLPQLRRQDTILRNESNSGAAVSRNRGISVANGHLIYLLDSDDEFICRDFVDDHQRYRDSKDLHYVDIISKGKLYTYPKQLLLSNFFTSIFCKHQFICQTSTLMFNRDLSLRFDESLPKHQDWDFVHDFLRANEGRVVKINGRVHFDRSDKMSISRTFAPNKSLPWLDKLSREGCAGSTDLFYVRYFLLGSAVQHFPWMDWTKSGCQFLFQGRLDWRSLIKSFVRRLLQGPLRKADSSKTPIG